MSVQENAAMLRQAGQEVEQAIRGAVSQTAADIQAISQKLQMVRESAENSTSTAAMALGESHPQLNEIVGAAAHSVEEVERMRGLLSQLEMELDGVANTGGTLNSAFEQAAAYLMGGG